MKFFDVLDKAELEQAVEYFSKEVENAPDLSQEQLEKCLEYMKTLRQLHEFISLFPKSKLTQDERNHVMAIMASHGITVEELCFIPTPREIA